MSDEQKSPNMEDVAKMAGVSKMTVSRVLRGYPGCSSETIQKVQHAAESLGYRNNPMVASLMADIRKKTRGGKKDIVIAILDDSISKRTAHIATSWDEHLEGIQKKAVEFGYKVETFYYRKEQLSEDRLNQIFSTRNVRGIIVPYQLNFISLNRLDFKQIASVTLGYSVQEPPINRVVPDYFMGIYQTLDNLKTRGYRRFALVVTKHVLLRVRKLWLGAYLAWHQWMEEEPIIYVYDKSSPDETEPRQLKRFIRDKKVDCVLCNINELIMEPSMSNWFADNEIGFAMLNWTGYHQSIAGVHNSNALQGARAMEILNQQIITNNFGLPADPVLSLVRPKWIEGATIRKFTRQTTSPSSNQCDETV